MDDIKYEKEIEKKERFTQTFLLIGSFLLATYSGEGELISRLFAGTLVFGLIYYVFLTNMNVNSASDILGITPVDIIGLIFSLLYSFYLITYSAVISNNGYSVIGYVFYVTGFTGFFLYALLSPPTTEKLHQLGSKFIFEHKLIYTILFSIFLILSLVITFYEIVIRG